jgi:hypothetical protein
MPVQQMIDPNVVAGLADPWLKQREQELIGGAMGTAMTALQKEDYPGMAQALQTVAGLHPQLGISMIGEMQRAQQYKETKAWEREKEAERRREWELTPRVIGGAFFGPQQYGLPPAKAGDPWRSLTPEAPAPAVPGAAAAPAAGAGGPAAWDPAGKSEDEIKNETLARMPAEQRPAALAMWPTIVGMEDYSVNPGRVSKMKGLGTVATNAAATLAQVRGHDPYNETEFPERNAAYIRFNTQQLPQLRNLSASFEHINTVDEIMAHLHNGDVPKANQLLNWLGVQMGKGPAVGANVGIKIMSTEVAKAIAQSNPALADREEIQMLLNPNSSDEQRQWAFGSLEQLIGEQLLVTKHLYGESTRRKDFDRYLMPRAKAFTARLEEEHGARPAPGPMGLERVAPGATQPPAQQPQQPPALTLPPGATRESIMQEARDAMARAPHKRAAIEARMQQLLQLLGRGP